MHFSDPNNVDSLDFSRRFSNEFVYTGWTQTPHLQDFHQLDSHAFYLERPATIYAPLPPAPLSPLSSPSRSPAIENSSLGLYNMSPLPKTEQQQYQHHQQQHHHHHHHHQHQPEQFSHLISPSYPESVLHSPVLSDSSSYCSPPPQETVRVHGACKPFILKLGFLLSRPELYADVARWDSTGTIFIITVCPRLINEVLPEIFNHSSVSAFTRQLTTYSFSHLKPIDVPQVLCGGEKTKGLSIWQNKWFTRDDTSTLNRLLPRPSRARVIHSKEKVASSTLLAYSRRFLDQKR